MRRALTTAAFVTAAAMADAAEFRGGAERPEPGVSRCDLDGEVGYDVFVEYALSHTHVDKHIIWSVRSNEAKRGDYELGFSEERVVAIGDFKPGGACELLWESGESAAGPTTLAVTPFRLPTPADFASANPTLPLPWQIAGTIDFSGDGAADLLWWNAETGERRAWIARADGTWRATSVAGGPPGAPDPTGSWRPAAAVRLDEDGTPGVIWHKPGDPVPMRYYRTQWTGSELVLHSEAPLDDLDQPGQGIVAAGDFDQDGQDDLLWQHNQSGRLRVCFLDGGTLRTCSTMIPDGFELPDFNEDAHWRVVGPR